MIELAYEIVEPKQWYPADDRREPVIDHSFSPPRIVRYVGWRNCMRCGEQYFSQDVARLRLCLPCRTDENRANNYI